MYVALALMLLCTALALVHVPRLGRRAYFLSVGVIELPQVAALYLVLATALSISEGDLSGGIGIAQLILVLLMLAGHLVLMVRSARARPVVRHAFARAGLHVEAETLRHWLARLVMPFPLRPWGVVRTHGVAYGDAPRQRLDVYGRRRGSRTAGVLIYFHGGGYSGGSRHWESRELLHHFAQRGWLCISAGYRLRPHAGFTEHLDDARSVVAWAHQHAAEYGGDASTLVLSGSSAGAHLTSLCALTQDQQPNRAVARIDAAVCLYGWYERYFGRGPDESVGSSPLYLDAAEAPPFLIAHGDHDTDAPVEQARRLERHLREQSQHNVIYAELPGAQHGFDLFRSWRFASVIAGIDAFVDALARNRARAPS